MRLQASWLVFRKESIALADILHLSLSLILLLLCLCLYLSVSLFLFIFWTELD